MAIDYVHPDTIGYGASVTLSLNQLGQDADGDALQLAQLIIEDTSTSVTINEQGELTLRPLKTGTQQWAFQLSDGEAESGLAFLTVTVDGPTKRQHHRFLLQSTFGPTSADMEGYASFEPVEWLEQQLAEPVSLHLPNTEAMGMTNEARGDAWLYFSTTAPDQLRQRVAFALSELFVVSVYGSLSKKEKALITYYDLLLSGALGNFRELLERVSLHPAMGVYLTMINSRKADENRGFQPDENYAREVMQLFTIGLYELHPDGTLKLDAANQPIPSYTQQDVQNIARAFTGWRKSDVDYVLPMEANEAYHDTDSKEALGHTLPAGQTALEDLRQVLDILFEHPNTPPFFAKHMILRLVSSNPSPEYVERVASVFIDNGEGVRGDIGAVVRAILLDEEALGLVPAYPPKKLKEPVITLVNLARAIDSQYAPMTTLNSRYAYNNAKQGPLRSPSVFNFFSPDYLIANGQKVAPEAELLSWSRYVSLSNYMRGMVMSDTIPDYSYLIEEYDNVDGVIEKISDLFYGGDMNPSLELQLRELIESANNPTGSIKTIGALIVSSDEFFIQD
ncbi:DUF1800 family protein [Ferrimonas balearica]|nr:DUF1800 family protein [Ferrimonas balearica]MBY5995214.1 DUF1800 family protein [Ferrimonas balearica]